MAGNPKRPRAYSAYRIMQESLLHCSEVTTHQNPESIQCTGSDDSGYRTPQGILQEGLRHCQEETTHEKPGSVQCYLGQDSVYQTQEILQDGLRHLKEEYIPDNPESLVESIQSLINTCKRFGSFHDTSMMDFSPSMRIPSFDNATPRRDDEKGHLIFKTEDILDNRYVILDTLGKGAFGQVVKVHVTTAQDVLAVKIIRNGKGPHGAARREIRVLEKLSKEDPGDKKSVVKMVSLFEHYGHVCISFPILGLSLQDFSERHKQNGYSLDEVWAISFQLCNAVKFLHRSGITHTDIKPENILFVNSEYEDINGHRVVKNPEIRLIDFGWAALDYEEHSIPGTTKYYRAPEDILELGWGHPLDVWSIGCTIFELYVGFPIFDEEGERAHLAMMEEVLGPIPYSLGYQTQTRFFVNGRLVWDRDSSVGRRMQEKSKFLSLFAKNRCHVSEEDRLFFDLIEKMLRYDPNERVTLSEAVCHKFFHSLPLENWAAWIDSDRYV